MHHIYTTDSIILRRVPSNDSAYYYLITKDLGLLYARAQGVRRETSRLKGTLQEFSLATIAYVRTKAGWKITTAIPQKNFWNETSDLAVRKIYARISACLIRLITGEEHSPEIFAIVEKGFSFLQSDPHESGSIEALILARVLFILGYIAPDQNTKLLFDNLSDFSLETVAQVVSQKSTLVRAINKAFKESQL